MPFCAFPVSRDADGRGVLHWSGKKWMDFLGGEGIFVGKMCIFSPKNLKVMKRVAIYGREASEEVGLRMPFVTSALAKDGVEVFMYKPFYDRLPVVGKDVAEDVKGCFATKQELVEAGVDMLFSVGGDGTFLEAASFLGWSDVPMLGVNMGRLGFLAEVPAGGVSRALRALREGSYEVEERTMLEVDVDGEWNEELGYALNEVGVRRTDTSSLLRIGVRVDEEEVATYWADGLLVATSTGSTAYSMSCGGPIVWPTCDALLLTPVCPHNLSMRPLVLPSDVTVRLDVESRTGEFVACADSRSARVAAGRRLEMLAAPFKLKVVKMPWHQFGGVLREKLMWGEDLRNKENERC